MVLLLMVIRRDSVDVQHRIARLTSGERRRPQVVADCRLIVAAAGARVSSD